MLENAAQPIDAVVETTTPQTEVVLFDADAEQRFTLEIEGDEAKYENTQIYIGLPNGVLEEYDRLREVFLESEGKNTDINTDAVAADEYLFGELCIDVLGFEGEKPENWQDLISYDEKKFGIGKLLGIKTISSDKEKVAKKRSWGQQISVNTVAIKARFGDQMVLTLKAHFEKKTPADVAAYNVIKNRVGLVDRGLDNSVIKIPAALKRKADLFDKINPRVEGYLGNPPLHHKAAFVTGFFEPSISSAEKK